MHLPDLRKKPKSLKVYKLRLKDTEQYSTGTTNPSWTREGKVFSSRNAVKSHLNWFFSGSFHTNLDGDFLRHGQPRNAEDYEVVEYELIKLNVIPAEEF